MIRRYDMEIYPATVWITTVDKFDFYKNKFDFYSTVKEMMSKKDPGTPVLSHDSAAITYAVRDKKYGNKGILIFLNAETLYLDFLSFDSAAHESVHAADIVWAIIGGITESYDESNEPYAYMVGWIAGKIGQFMIDYNKEKEEDGNE